MSESLCFKHNKHHVYSESECPWCEIERLKAEFEQYKARHYGQDDCNGCSDRDAEIEKLKAELEEARIKSERDDRWWSELTVKYEDAKRQLAEARAENDMLKETVANMELLLCRPKSCQIRREAARKEAQQ